MPEKKSLERINRKSKTQGNPLRPQKRSREKYHLKLYISGMTPRSQLAIENIRRICQDYLPGLCDLEIIDIFKHPVLAKEANVIAAPTLLKQSPLPMHRLIGDMSNIEKVLAGLDLKIAG